MADSTYHERRDAHRALARALADRPERQVFHLAAAAVEPDETVAAALEAAAHAIFRHGDAMAAITALVKAADLSPPAGGQGRRLVDAAYMGVDVTGELERASRLLVDARRLDRPARRPAPRRHRHRPSAAEPRRRLDTAHRLLTSAISTELEREERGLGALVEALYALALICHFGAPRRALGAVFHVLPAPRIALATNFSCWRARSPIPLPPPRTDRSRYGRRRALGGAGRDPRHSSRRRRLLCRPSGRVQGGPVHVVRDGPRRWCRRLIDRRPPDARSFAGRVPAGGKRPSSSPEEGITACDDTGTAARVGPAATARPCSPPADGHIDECRHHAAAMEGWGAPRASERLVDYARRAASPTLAEGNSGSAYRLLASISPPGALRTHVPEALLTAWIWSKQRSRRPAAENNDARRRDARRRRGRLSPRLRPADRWADALVASRVRPDDSSRMSRRFPRHLVCRSNGAPATRQRRAPPADRALDGGRARLVAARDLFDQLGASPWLARATAEFGRPDREPGAPRTRRHPSHTQTRDRPHRRHRPRRRAVPARRACRRAQYLLICTGYSRGSGMAPRASAA